MTPELDAAEKDARLKAMKAEYFKNMEEIFGGSYLDPTKDPKYKERMTWPFPLKPIPNDQKKPPFNPDNHEDAPV